MQPPFPNRVPVTIHQLGYDRVDHYAWMRDENWQTVLRDPSALQPNIRDHLEAENSYTEAVLKDQQETRDEIFSEMRNRTAEQEDSLPIADGPYEYYHRYNPGSKRPVYMRRLRSSEKDLEETLLDADALAKESSYFKETFPQHSSDHTLLAWGEDRLGSDVFRIKVRRISDGSLVGSDIESASGNFVFSLDGSFIFWVCRDGNARCLKVYRRTVGMGPESDVLIHEESDQMMYVTLSATASRQFILINISTHQMNEIRVISSREPEQSPWVLAAREANTRYFIEHWQDTFVIRTNRDGAIDFKLMRVPESNPSRANWTEWIPHRKGHYITNIAAFRDHFVRVERINGNDTIIVTDKGGAEVTVPVMDEAYAIGLIFGREYETTALRFNYASPTQPTQTIELDMNTGSQTVLKTQEISSGHDPKRYKVRQIQATSPDGTKVPVTLLARADILDSGPLPVLLKGYGAYGLAQNSNFDIAPLSLVDRGWIWATAHVRGGTEKGQSWYLDSVREKKPNTFLDFIAAADMLIADGYAEKGGIVAYGRSAGGMLMGAVANMRPDLWCGIFTEVPFVDVLNTTSDETLPLTPGEWPEWGNPIKSDEDYKMIASYSPYENVAAKPYCPILAMAQLCDRRVTYWEAAKWIANLRYHNTSDAPVLLSTNMTSGHAGASGRFDRFKDLAFCFAFALHAHARYNNSKVQ